MVVVANDPTVKAGSWGARTVEKIVRATELALDEELPIFWLVDSAGARITDQVQLFPGRRGAGRIFYNQVRLSGRVPAAVLPLRPVGGRRRLHPGLLRRGLHGRRERLDVPRLAPHGRGGDRRARVARGDGWRPACTRRCRDAATTWLPTTRAPSSSPADGSPTCRRPGARTHRRAPAAAPAHTLTAATIPDDPRAGYDIHAVVDALVDDGSFFEIKPLFARELVIGFAALEGMAVGDRRQQSGD